MKTVEDLMDVILTKTNMDFVTIEQIRRCYVHQKSNGEYDVAFVVSEANAHDTIFVFNHMDDTVNIYTIHGHRHSGRIKQLRQCGFNDLDIHEITGFKMEEIQNK